MPTTETKPRKQFMKWLTLGKDKDPEFLKDVFLFKERSDGQPFFDKGYLKAIDHDSTGKTYGFVTGMADGEPVIVDDFTFYCNPVRPK